MSIVLLTGQPYSHYHVAWKGLLRKLYPDVIPESVSLEEKPDFSSPALKGRSDAIRWEKLEEHVARFRSISENSTSDIQSEHEPAHDSASSRLLYCCDTRILSAPEGILERSDLIIVTFCKESDTFKNMLMQKADSKNYQKYVWPDSVDRFREFQKRYLAFPAQLKKKFLFVDDSASVESFSKGLILHVGCCVSRYAIGIGPVSTDEAFKWCTEAMKEYSTKEFSRRLFSEREQLKSQFLSNAKASINSLLDRYPQSSQDCVNFVLGITNRESFKSILMSAEEYKSYLMAIATQKQQIVRPILKFYQLDFDRWCSRNEPECKLTMANIFSWFALEHGEQTDQNLYVCDTSPSLIEFVKHWKECKDRRIEVDDMPFLDPELCQTYRHVCALRRLATKLYPVHNFFCLKNPGIFILGVKLLKSKNPLFIESGMNLVCDILCGGRARSEVQFAKYFHDKRESLPANVVVAALEGIGHLFKPLRDLMETDLDSRTVDETNQVAEYYESLAEVLSDCIWKTFESLFWGLSQHATVVQPSHLLDILKPVVFAKKHLLLVNRLSVYIAAATHHILRYGIFETVNVIMSFSGDLADIAGFQIRNEISRHIEQEDVEVSKLTLTVNKVLFSILNLLQRTGVPDAMKIDTRNKEFVDKVSDASDADKVSIAIQESTVDNLFSVTSASNVTEKHAAVQEFDSESIVFERIKRLRGDFARLQQLEAEKTEQEASHRKSNDQYRARVAELEATIRSYEEKFSDAAVREKDLADKIRLLERHNQELKSALVDASRIAESYSAVKGELHHDQNKPVSKDHVQYIRPVKSSLVMATDIDKIENDVSLETRKEFIRILHEERACIPEALRPSFSGMLKHLGGDLYSSQAHFLQEMLQNADDAKFNPDTKPTMHVFFSDTSVTIGHNEVGMSASDVLALCSAASSNKEAGLHTGQKGLGFKSVFACSNSPHILSGDWCFKFDVKAGDPDKMAYIDPYWVDKIPEHFEAVIGTLGGRDSNGEEGEEPTPGGRDSEVRTWIHLPFKSEPTLHCIPQNEIQSALNPIALLCARNLCTIHVYQSGPGLGFGSPATVRCKRSEERELSYTLKHDQFTSATSCIKRWRMSLELGNKDEAGAAYFEKIPWDSNGKLEFLAFEASINYPRVASECGERRVNSTLPTVIRVLFPLNNKLRKWPVCATLPVCNVGLPFILHADWDVVTSRANICLNRWNENLACCFVQMLRFAFQNISDLGIALSNYIVKINSHADSEGNSEMRSFWKEFEQSVKQLYFAQLPSNCFLADPSIDSLQIPDDYFLSCAGYQIVRHDSAEVSLDVLEHCNRRINVEAVLKCFQNGHSRKFSDWAESKEPEWWARLFELLLDKFKTSVNESEKQSIRELARQQPLYLVNDRIPREAKIEKPRSRWTVNFDVARTFVCVHKTQEHRYYTWRDEITVLRTTSKHELEFVRQVLAVRDAGTEIISEAILDLHSESCFDRENRWGDFAFLANLLAEVSMSMEEMGSRLWAPTITGGHMPLRKCTLVTLMGMRIADTELLISSRSDSCEDYPVYIAVSDSKLTVCDAARIEKMLIIMGCKLPPDGTQPEYRSNLPDLSALSQDDVEACVGLLRLSTIMGHHRIYLSSCLLALHGDAPDAAATEARLTFTTSVASARYLLPCVQVPEFGMELAEMLGIGTKMNFCGALRAMLALVQRECSEVAAYTTWLAYCQNFIGTIKQAMQLREDTDSTSNPHDLVYEARYWIDLASRNSFIVADVETATGQLQLRQLSIIDILCPDEDAFGELAEGTSPVNGTAAYQEHISFVVGRLLGKAIVCLHRNGIFSPFVQVLQSLGCKKEPCLAETLLALHVLRVSGTSYVRGGKGIMLTLSAMQSALHLYSHIEKLLKDVGETAQRRTLLRAAVPKRSQVESVVRKSGPLLHDLDFLPEYRDGPCSLQDFQALNASEDMSALCAVIPLLLSDFSLPVGLHPTEVSQNTLGCIVDSLRDSGIKLLDPRLSQACPLLCQLLGISQLKDRTVSYFRTSLGENVPRFMPAISEAFNRLLNRPVTVLKVTYIDLIVYIMDGHSLRVRNEETLDARNDHSKEIKAVNSPAHLSARRDLQIREFEIWSEAPYVIAGDIVFVRRVQTDVTLRLVLRRLLIQLLVTRQRKPTDDYAVARAIQGVQLNDLQAWGTEKTMHFNSSEVEFPTGLTASDGLDEDELECLKVMDSCSGNDFCGSIADRGAQHFHAVPENSKLGVLRHADHIFRDKLKGSGPSSNGDEAKQVDYGCIQLKRLDPSTFVLGSDFSGKPNSEDCPDPKVVDSKAVERVGLLGELFASIWLQQVCGKSFDPHRHWVSSARLKFFPIYRVGVDYAKAGIDDSKGYDMEIEDVHGIFNGEVDNGVMDKRTDLAPGGVRRCFVEVKSTAGRFRGEFHLSRNELKRRDECAGMGEARYILLFVEYVENPEKTKFAGFYDWSAGEDIIYEPSQVKACFKSENAGSRENSRECDLNLFGEGRKERIGGLQGGKRWDIGSYNLQEPGETESRTSGIRRYQPPRPTGQAFGNRRGSGSNRSDPAARPTGRALVDGSGIHRNWRDRSASPADQALGDGSGIRSNLRYQSARGSFTAQTPRQGSRYFQ